MYVNFDGGPIKAGSDSNALTRTSYLAPADLEYQAFDPSRFGGDQALDDIMWRLKAAFADFDVTLIDELPDSGDFMMVMVGGRAVSLGQSPGTLGLSSLDCLATAAGVEVDLNPLDIVFVFSDDIADYGLGVAGLAHIAAHEMAHSLGLGHVARFGDLMYPYIGGDDVPTWGTGPVLDDGESCLTDGIQDDVEYLGRALPRRATILAPPDGAVVDGAAALNVTVSITAATDWPVNWLASLWLDGAVAQCTMPCAPDGAACPGRAQCTTPDEGRSWQCGPFASHGCTVQSAAARRPTLGGPLVLATILGLARRRRAPR